MSESYWREHAAPIITKIILDNKDKTEKEIRRLISAAYPYGERAYHPYKIWLSEVKKQISQLEAIKAGRPIKNKIGEDPHCDQPSLF